MLFYRLYFRSPYKNSISVQVTCKLLEKSHLLHQRKERSQQISWLLLYFWFLSFFVFKTQIWVLWKQYYILVHSRHMLPPKISWEMKLTKTLKPKICKNQGFVSIWFGFGLNYSQDWNLVFVLAAMFFFGSCK